MARPRMDPPLPEATAWQAQMNADTDFEHRGHGGPSFALSRFDELKAPSQSRGLLAGYGVAGTEGKEKRKA
jgi:hypothetical protein